jgi:hypothetical protein
MPNPTDQENLRRIQEIAARYNADINADAVARLRQRLAEQRRAEPATPEQREITEPERGMEAFTNLLESNERSELFKAVSRLFMLIGLLRNYHDKGRRSLLSVNKFKEENILQTLQVIFGSVTEEDQKLTEDEFRGLLRTRSLTKLDIIYKHGLGFTEDAGLSIMQEKTDRMVQNMKRLRGLWNYSDSEKIEDILLELEEHPNKNVTDSARDKRLELQKWCELIFDPDVVQEMRYEQGFEERPDTSAESEASERRLRTAQMFMQEFPEAGK